jgi:hypothetical protein
MMREEVAPGFSVEGSEGGCMFLIDPGKECVMTTSGSITGMACLVKTSHGMRATTSELAVFYL